MDLPETQRFWKGVTWRAAVATLVVAGLMAIGVVAAITGASGKSEASASDDYASLLEPVGTSGISRVILSERAAERLGIETSPVRAAVVRNQKRQVIPYSAVVYDAEGVAWTYTNPKPLTYLRHRLSVDHVAGANAVLLSGPPNGTRVVSVGAIELFGAEIDFGKG